MVASGAAEEIDLMLKGSIVAPVARAGAVFIEGEASREDWQIMAGARFKF